jgi:alginate O-acetyltransferase complex protein AlgI
VIFHSLDFVAFFVITTLVYWRLPRRGQNLFVVAVSYVFYGYIHPWFVALLALTTVTDYTVARAIERYPSRRRALLAITLTTNLGLLGVFKYFNFFAENVQAALAALGWQLSMPVLALILPVGLSFYTFQSLSYVIDVYSTHSSWRDRSSGRRICCPRSRPLGCGHGLWPVRPRV